MIMQTNINSTNCDSCILNEVLGVETQHVHAPPIMTIDA